MIKSIIRIAIIIAIYVAAGNVELAKAQCQPYGSYLGCTGSQLRYIQHQQFLARNVSHFALIKMGHEIAEARTSTIRIVAEQKRASASRMNRKQREAARKADWSHSMFIQREDGTWTESNSYVENDRKNRRRRN